MSNFRERHHIEYEDNKKPKKTIPNVGLGLAIGVAFGLLLKNMGLGIVIGIVFVLMFPNKRN